MIQRVVGAVEAQGNAAQHNARALQRASTHPSHMLLPCNSSGMQNRNPVYFALIVTPGYADGNLTSVLPMPLLQPTAQA